MAKYITAQRLAQAVSRLRDSRASTGFVNFLILRRALKLSGNQPVGLSTKDTSLQKAITDLVCWAPDENAPETPKPFINVFGTVNDDKLGLRAKKFRSNGVADTLKNSTWTTQVVELSRGQGAQAASLQKHYKKDLADKTLVKDEARPLPRLDDAAIWFHRTSDITSFAKQATDAAVLDEIINHFVDETGMSADVTDLFDTTAKEAAPGTGLSMLASAPANPSEYLPFLTSGPTPQTAAPSGCSFALTVALAAKGFVILTGASGTGKTRAGLQIAQGVDGLPNYANGVQGPAYEFVPVGADWTDARPILGYPNPFGPARKLANGQTSHETYEITQTVRLLLRAADPSNSLLPHFLLLDEMNLSHVERYFSHFLSLLEANRSSTDDHDLTLLGDADVALIAEILQLREPESPEANASKQLATAGTGLPIPPNCLVVGTVNVDETTYMFSPKVLDRAHVIELQACTPDDYLAKKTVDDTLAETIGVAEALELLKWAIARRQNGDFDRHPDEILSSVCTEVKAPQLLQDSVRAALQATLSGSFRLLNPLGFAFGYRIVNEVYAYIATWLRARHLTRPTDAQRWDDWPTAVDSAILQKVLPKVHGNRRQLGESLAAIAAFFRGGSKESTPPAAYRLGDSQIVAIDAAQKITFGGRSQMLRSATKIEAMHQRLRATGYVTFIH